MLIRHNVIYGLVFVPSLAAYALLTPRSFVESAVFGGGLGLIAVWVTSVYNRSHARRKQ